MQGTAGSGMWGSEGCCAKDGSTCPRPGRRDALTLEEARVGVPPTSWDEPGAAAEVLNAAKLGSRPPLRDLPLPAEFRGARTKA